MPVTHRFQGKLLVVETKGAYEQEELKAAFEAGLASPDLPRDVGFVLDIRNSTMLNDRSTAEIEQLATFIGERGAQFNSACAIVAEEGLQYGLMRMAAVFAEDRGLKCGVFTKLYDAITWLENHLQTLDTDAKDVH